MVGVARAWLAGTSGSRLSFDYTDVEYSCEQNMFRMMITIFWKAGNVNGVMSSKQAYPRVSMELSSRTMAQGDTF